jgi:hypothetical protein
VLADLLALGQQEAGYGRAAEDEVLRRWRLALVRTAFPRCDKLAHLLDNWTSYAAEEAPRARPAGADVGRGELAGGPCKAGCGAPAATALHGHALCYRCAGLAGQEVANFSPESVGAWLASRRAAA